MSGNSASVVQGLSSAKLDALVEMMFLAASADGEFSEVERAHFLHSVESLTDGRLGKPALKSMGIPLLPRTLLHALESFEADPISARAFGDYKAVYLAHKTREWERSFYSVSDEQRANWLTFL